MYLGYVVTEEIFLELEFDIRLELMSHYSSICKSLKFHIDDEVSVTLITNKDITGHPESGNLITLCSINFLKREFNGFLILELFPCVIRYFNLLEKKRELKSSQSSVLRYRERYLSLVVVLYAFVHVLQNLPN